jgi:predicted MFS family arabinose efflux permease
MGSDSAMAQPLADQTASVTGWRTTFAALCATLVGNGLSRFAYTPLIPALIDAAWFTPAEVVYLGAATFAGYLGGAVLARSCARRTSSVTWLRAMMALATVAFFACAFPLSFAWFFVWRFLAGFTGGVLLVLAAPTVLPHVPQARRGLAGGIIFTGVGIGIAASGTLVPSLLHWGLRETWFGLGALSLLLTALAWRNWPASVPPQQAARPGNAFTPALTAIYIGYGLNAMGLVPHMVFLVDYVAHGLGDGLAVGARYWVLFGIGALLGPSIAGHLGDRLGFGPALRLALLGQALCIGLVAVTSAALALTVSSIAIGAAVPAISSLVLGRIHEVAPAESESAWSHATVAFAIGAAVAAYFYSYLFARGSSYTLLFALGAAALFAALAIDLIFGRRGDAR